MYRLSEDQTAIIDKVRRVGDEMIAPHAAAVDRESRFPKEALDALGEAGLLGLTVPEKYGGLGQDLRTAAAVAKPGRKKPSAKSPVTCPGCGS